MLYRGKDENFFLLLAQPPQKVQLENIPPREYVFVVDVSGSMNGFPLTVSKQLLKSLISHLRPTDTFNVILFAGTSSVMAEASLPATRHNIKKAIAVIDAQQGGGGTRLEAAIKRALAMPHDRDISRSIVVVTDGYISAEKSTFTMIRKNLGEANVFAFGIGSSVNRYLIEGLAKAGRGEPFVVTDKGDTAAIASGFRKYIESPILTNIKVEYTDFEAYSTEPTSIPDLMAQRPIQIFGKWKGRAEGSITITGISGNGPFRQSFNVATTTPRNEHRSLRYLWARTRVAELSDYSSNMGNSEVVKEITSLGLTYELLTKYTSFVAVHEEIRNTGNDALDVTQPLSLPKGVSDMAIGAAHPTPYSPNVTLAKASKSVPEPELLIILAFMAVGGALLFIGSHLRMNTGE